jgi:tripartite-type tricarboxylate transporter receptor subunit TctC
MMIRAAQVLLCALALLLAPDARAQDAAAFYRGKTVRLMVGATPGGGFSGYATAIAPSLGRALGTTVVVEHLPGAGGLNALNRLYAAGPDGLAILIANGTLAALSQLVDPANARFDFARLGLLGIISAPPWLWVTGASGPVATPADALKADKIRWAAAGVLDGESTGAAFSCEGLRLPCQIIPGYPGSTEVMLALAKGEMDAAYLSEITARPFAASGQIRIVATMARQRARFFPEVPTIFEALPLDAEQQRWIDLRADLAALGRVVVVPPDLPADRLAFLRATLRKVLTDPTLVAELAGTPYYLDYRDAETARRATSAVLGGITAAERPLLAEIILRKYR